jgi:D-lactate dehydrogenase
MTDRLIVRLQQAIGTEQVLASLEDRSQWASDASIYLLLPRVVVIPRTSDDVRAILAVASTERVPVCFRAGGTSLSGQAVTDGILIVVSRHLRGITVSADANSVTCEPGAVGAWVNTALAPHGRRIGPDPASIQAAEMGGIVANNASGMCCGVAENSYHTVTGMRLLLSDGSAIDTGSVDADAQFKQGKPQLYADLATLAAELSAHPTLPAQIRQAFATKNTVGYSLNALIDCSLPVKILEKLVVGSEGTLAFISSVTLRTLPLPRFRATAWLLFSDVDEASRAVAPLADIGARAIELLDAVALRRISESLPHDLPAGEPAALLVEFQEADEERLQERIATAGPLLLGFGLCAPATFTRDAAIQAKYWKIRKGLFPSVGAVRTTGTAVVIEDVTFPVALLADGVRALRRCFAAHGYDDAVIFGHAKDGNLHFTLTPDLSRGEEVKRYDHFMNAMVDAVLAMGGHLKAEHGTGRNMAPFVEKQWGKEAVGFMRRIKALLDPLLILNPGVLLSDDPQAHLQFLKTLPAVHPTVDRCIECGFCEPVCPSRDVTYSPRQRIAALRAVARHGLEATAITAAWKYRGLDTCAADGMCETACPVHINTGDLVRLERAAQRPQWQQRLALATTDYFDLITGTLRLGFRLAQFAAIKHLPRTSVALPPPAAALPDSWPTARGDAPTIVYFPTCISRMMGPGSLAAALADCCRLSGIGLMIPDGVNNLCCGQPYSSKGFPEAATAMLRRTITAVLAICRPDTIFVTDTSTCAGQWDDIDGLLTDEERQRWQAVRRLSPAAVVSELLIPRLTAAGVLRPEQTPILVHPTCSEHRHHWVGSLTAATTALGTPIIPLSAGCCGMAGDKGWTTPQLTSGAGAREGSEASCSAATIGITTSTTCALAMSAVSGRSYQHLWLTLRERLSHVPQTHATRLSAATHSEAANALYPR